MTDYERLGGDTGVARLIDAFVDRVFDDFIIGFFFIGKDRERIKIFEAQHAARHLGGPSRYGGRPVHRVHGPLPINRGHFRRRLAILRTVLREHQVDEDIIERWVSRDRALEAAVTDGTDCTSSSGS